MKYMGSKNRIAKHILPIILKDRNPEQWYVEPFVGGANMIDKVDGNRLGADNNPFLIEALMMIRDTPELIPKNNIEFTEADYNTCNPSKKITHEFTCAIIGYAGFAISFGAKWFGGWSRGKDSKGRQRDYVAEQFRAAVKQSKKLDGCCFMPCEYQKLDLPIPENSIIYCDPPYKGTTKYKDGDFDHAEFWQKCRDWCADGHQLFISEYNAPDDFVCVWQQELKVSVAKDGKQKTAVEKLFVHKSQHNGDNND